MESSENLRDFSADGEERAPAPKHHRDDVRFYLAIGVCVVVAVILLAQTGDALFRVPAGELQVTLDAFGLFDAALFGIVGTVLGFYFASKD